MATQCAAARDDKVHYKDQRLERLACTNRKRDIIVAISLYA